MTTFVSFPKIDVRKLGFRVNLLVQAKTLMVIVRIVRGIYQLLAWLTQMESVSILVQSSRRNRSGGVSNSSMGCGRLLIFQNKTAWNPQVKDQSKFETGRILFTSSENP